MRRYALTYRLPKSKRPKGVFAKVLVENRRKQKYRIDKYEIMIDRTFPHRNQHFYY